MQILKGEVKEKILKKASMIFLEKGYDRATMRQIAEKSEISVGNIYRYFSNKEKILEEIIEEFEIEFQTFASQIDKNIFSDDTQKSCNEFIESLIEIFEEHYYSIKLLSKDITNNRFKKFRYMLVDSITEKIMVVAKEISSKKINTTIASAIALSTIVGVEKILVESIDEKGYSSNFKDNVRIYLKVTLKGLINRMKEE